MTDRNPPPDYNNDDDAVIAMLKEARLSDALIAQTHSTSKFWRDELAKIDAPNDKNLNLDSVFQKAADGKVQS